MDLSDIEVVSLRNANEDVFWRHVATDPLDYRRFISDWKFERQNSDIFMAIRESEIEGLMLVFKESQVHLRGSPDAVRTLLNHLDLEEFDLISPPECKNLVLERFEPRICKEMLMMCVSRDNATISKVHEPTRLTPEDADEISLLMRESDPVWSETTPDDVKEMMKWSYWLGIKHDHSIVSVGRTTLNEHGSVIGVVATGEGHRLKGYATSVVSALVEEVLKQFDKALVYVPVSNSPAIHIYERIGFRTYKRYLFIRT